MYIKIFTQQHIIKSAAETPVQLGRLKIAATEAKQLKYNTVVLDSCMEFGQLYFLLRIIKIKNLSAE